MILKIAGKTINDNHPPFIIAEMSGNHNQSLSRALEIIEAAADSGVDAIKIQTYRPDTMTLNIKGGNFDIKDQSSIWKGRNLYDLYSEAYTPWEWHKDIFSKAKELGLICFSSPFDESAVDFLETLDVPAYKIASFENNHIPLIKKVAKTRKPIIISTGMATISELDTAVNAVKNIGCDQIILLKCTSTYPAKPENSNLNTIPHMKDLFQCEVGLSDHTFGLGAAVAATALGASVIEKHFTLSRDDGGVDSEFSLEPSEMKQLVNETKNAWQALGDIKYGPTNNEKNSLLYKRSIYVSQDIKKEEIFSNLNLKIIRPGDGAPPSFYEEILGTKSKKDFKKGTPLKLKDIID